MSRVLGQVTRTGWGALTGALGFGVAAVALRAPEIGMLAVGCLTAFGVGAVFMARPARIEVGIEVAPSRVARGEPAVASVTVRNAGRRASSSARLVVPYSDRADGGAPPDGPPAGRSAHGGRGRSGQGSRVVLRPLPAGSRRTIAVPLPTDRRGVLRIGPVGLVTTDPLGLFSRYESLGGQAQLPVHPAAVPLAPLPSARSSSPDGLPVDSRVEGGVTFHALREYTPGDDLRHVHWRSSARAGTLLVRRHVDPSEPVTTVVLDIRRQAYPDAAVDPGAGGGGTVQGQGQAARAFDTAVDAAASVVLASTRSRFPVRLHTTGGLRLDCRDRRADGTAALDALAGAAWTDATGATDAAGPGDPLAEAARSRGRRGVGSLVIVTGRREIGQLAVAGALAGQFEQVVVLRVGGVSVDGGVSVNVSVPGAPAGPGPDQTSPGASQRFESVADGRLRVLDITDTAQLTSVWPSVAGAQTAGTRRFS
ncbi:hypothetical protein CcI49_35490 [Frankia sp. CcI49]|nr:hypothetical protein CcI49_35490 [Frankia sp. CcI49]